MSLELIDAAIVRHLEWVARFRTALAGTGEQNIDLGQASDDSTCALGKWLALPETKDLLGMDYLNRTQALHGTFHEIAGAIVGSRRPRPFMQVHPVGGGVAWLAALRSAGPVARNITIGLLDLLLG